MLHEQQVEEVLNYSNFNPDDYNEWIAVGMILKYEGGDSYFNLWDSWSRQSGKYDSSVMEKKWRSFKSTGNSNLTMATLVDQAQKNGWKYDNGERIQGLGWNEEIDDGIFIKKAEPVPQKPEQHTESNINDISSSRLIKALNADSGKYSDLIEKAEETLLHSEQAHKYYTERGISLDTVKHYHAGWIENLNGITGALIPGSYDGFAVRNVNYENHKANFDKLTAEEKKKNQAPRKYAKPNSKDGALDIPVGLKQVIQEPNAQDLRTGLKLPIIIVEGYFDVLSIYEATGINAISLNGIGNIDTVAKVLKHYKINRPIILALDNDDTGAKNNDKHLNTLQEQGFNAYLNKEFYGEYKDANEFLQKDRNGFIKAIEKAKEIPYKKYTDTLNENQQDGFRKYIKNRKNRKALLTGFKTLDGENFLNGGLRPGLLYGIGAISSLGKTSFVLQLADNLAKDGNPVLYFSLEMNRYELMAKSISRYTYENSYNSNTKNPDMGFNTLDILDGRREDRIVDYEKEFLNDCTDLYFSDTGKNLRILESRNISNNGEVPVELIREKVNEQISFTGKPPVVIVDYLQILGHSNKFNLSEKEFIDNNIKNLKLIATEFDVPVIVISSFNRKSYNAEAEFDSFLGSSCIEYSVDVLLTLERNIKLTEKQQRSAGDSKKKIFYYASNVELAKIRERETGKKWLKMKILKNRTGKANGEIGLMFDSRYNFFLDYGEIYKATGTTETLAEESERHDKLLKGKTTLKDSPEPAEVNGLSLD